MKTRFWTRPFDENIVASTSHRDEIRHFAMGSYYFVDVFAMSHTDQLQQKLDLSEFTSAHSSNNPCETDSTYVQPNKICPNCNSERSFLQ